MPSHSPLPQQPLKFFGIAVLLARLKMKPTRKGEREGQLGKTNKVEGNVEMFLCFSLSCIPSQEGAENKDARHKEEVNCPFNFFRSCCCSI